MIDVKNLKKSFGDVHVLKGITTHVNKGECICIIGPSGSGKSTFPALPESSGKTGGRRDHRKRAADSGSESWM